MTCDEDLLSVTCDPLSQSPDVYVVHRVSCRADASGPRLLVSAAGTCS